jgi:NAD(P)-dependent dehydrogenase (short-subunit alcohol dehydrogenase family)
LFCSFGSEIVEQTMGANDEAAGPDLTGQVVIVTGGSRGIGRALSQALAGAGASVVVVARSSRQVSETVDAIITAHGWALGVTADVSDRQSVASMIKEAERQFGHIDLLINNAAVAMPLGPIADTDPDAWWRCQEINIRGPLFCAHAVLPAMYARGQGRIINMVSTAGLMPLPYISAYIHSKTALIRLSELMALESELLGVHVFAVNPGAVRTDMMEQLANSPEGQKWTPWVRPQFDSMETPVHRVVSLTLAIASGRADALAGRLISASQDFEQVIASAAEVVRDGLYTLRIPMLQDQRAKTWDVK